jgi:hypothetical protein
MKLSPREKVKRLPKDYVAAITPKKLMEYLRSNGWRQTAVIEKDEVLEFRHPGKPEFRIDVLLTKKYADWLHRIADAIITAAAVEKRPFWETYMDMAGRYYVAPHTYSTTPQVNGKVNGPAKRRKAKKADVT